MVTLFLDTDAAVAAVLSVPIICPDESSSSYGGTTCAANLLLDRRRHLCRACTKAVEYRDEVILAIQRAAQ